jgi:hypothetical protein
VSTTAAMLFEQIKSLLPNERSYLEELLEKYDTEKGETLVRIESASSVLSTVRHILHTGEGESVLQRATTVMRRYDRAQLDSMERQRHT